MSPPKRSPSKRTTSSQNGAPEHHGVAVAPAIETGDPAVVVTVKAPKVIYQIAYAGYNAAGDLIDEKLSDPEALYTPDFDNLRALVNANLEQVKTQTIAQRNGTPA